MNYYNEYTLFFIFMSLQLLINNHMSIFYDILSYFDHISVNNTDPSVSNVKKSICIFP